MPRQSTYRYVDCQGVSAAGGAAQRRIQRQWSMLTSSRRCSLGLLIVLLAIPAVRAQVRYQLLLTGGHVIDPRNQIDAVMDVAVADGKIAAVRAGINPAEAQTVVDVSGLYVT